MKKYASTPPILAAVVSVTGCVPMEPVAEVPDDDICRLEAPIGSHIIETDCDYDPNTQRGNRSRTDRDINGVFGDIVLDGNSELPDVIEGNCGGARD